MSELRELCGYYVTEATYCEALATWPDLVDGVMSRTRRRVACALHVLECARRNGESPPWRSTDGTSVHLGRLGAQNSEDSV